MMYRSSGSPQRHSQFLTIPSTTYDRINEATETRDIPRSVPRFDRPEPDTEKLLWIHVPYTHTGWVSQVIRRACHDRHEPDLCGQVAPRMFPLRTNAVLQSTEIYQRRKLVSESEQSTTSGATCPFCQANVYPFSADGCFATHQAWNFRGSPVGSLRKSSYLPDLKSC